MDKKGENLLHYVVPILLILLVLALIVPYFFSTTNLGKSVLKTLGLNDDSDLIQKNEEAQNSFKEFIKNLRQCSQYKEDNCFCNAPLTGFSDIHAIKASQDGVKVEAIKDFSEITLAEEKIQHTSCYVTKEGFSVRDSLAVYFDEESAYVIVPGFIDDKARLLATNNIYKKQGNLCFIASDFAEKPKKCEK